MDAAVDEHPCKKKVHVVSGLHTVLGSDDKPVTNAICTINLLCASTGHSITTSSVQIKKPHIFVW